MEDQEQDWICTVEWISVGIEGMWCWTLYRVEDGQLLVGHPYLSIS